MSKEDLHSADSALALARNLSVIPGKEKEKKGLNGNRFSEEAERRRNLAFIRGLLSPYQEIFSDAAVSLLSQGKAKRKGLLSSELIARKKDQGLIGENVKRVLDLCVKERKGESGEKQIDIKDAVINFLDNSDGNYSHAAKMRISFNGSSASSISLSCFNRKSFEKVLSSEQGFVGATSEKGIKSAKSLLLKSSDRYTIKWVNLDSSSPEMLLLTHNKNNPLPAGFQDEKFTQMLMASLRLIPGDYIPNDGEMENIVIEKKRKAEVLLRDVYSGTKDVKSAKEEALKIEAETSRKIAERALVISWENGTFEWFRAGYDYLISKTDEGELSLKDALCWLTLDRKGMSKENEEDVYVKWKARYQAVVESMKNGILTQKEAVDMLKEERDLRIHKKEDEENRELQEQEAKKRRELVLKRVKKIASVAAASLAITAGGVELYTNVLMDRIGAPAKPAQAISREYKPSPQVAKPQPVVKKPENIQFAVTDRPVSRSYSLGRANVSSVKPGTIIVGDTYFDEVKRHDSNGATGDILVINRPGNVRTPYGAYVVEVSSQEDGIKKLEEQIEIMKQRGCTNGCSEIRVTIEEAVPISQESEKTDSEVN